MEIPNVRSIWDSCLERYKDGEWRAPIFRDLVLADAAAQQRERPPVMLDVGCGKGFDGDSRIQRSLAAAAGTYIGVEPDETIDLQPIFTSCYRTALEIAPIPKDSVDIGFAVMVLEHLSSPESFWQKVFYVLRPGGVFWAFTMDARHYFVKASLFAERANIKDYYLNAVRGIRGIQRYENYPVYYRSNTPDQISQFTNAFESQIFLNFTRVGQMDYYLPSWLRPIGHALDRRSIRRQKPGSILAVRVAK